MQKDEVCMFCYYRNKRLAACAHAGARPDPRFDAAPDADAAATMPAPVAARAHVQPPRARRPR